MKRAKIKYLLTCLIITISLCLGSGCVYVETPPPPSPPPPEITAPTNPNWTPPPIESNAPLLPDFIPVVAKVKPSVVAINTKFTEYDFFNRPFTQEGAGSGWIIGEEGYIVTNNHVVEGAESITVTLNDGRTFSAGIVGTDLLTDLAIVKINAQNLAKANRGDSSKLKVGEWVLAIGNSLGLGVTPSEGIVRCLGASIAVSGQTLYDLIGISAAINPGNSGGPLVNRAGGVIGITSVKIAMVGVEGMGWAISINSAMPIITDLINNGYVVRPYLGVVFCNLDQWPAIRYDLAVDNGAFIAEVVRGSPADKAGIEPGDVIVSLNDQEITTVQELAQAIHSCQIGQQVKITYWRGDTKKTTYVTLAESPPP